MARDLATINQEMVDLAIKLNAKEITTDQYNKRLQSLIQEQMQSMQSIQSPPKESYIKEWNTEDARKLETAYKAGEISFDEYAKRLKPLFRGKEIQTGLETSLPIKTLEEDIGQRTLRTSKQLTGQDSESPIFDYAFEEAKKRREEELKALEDIPPLQLDMSEENRKKKESEALRFLGIAEDIEKGKARLREETTPLRYTTGEYIEPISGVTALSNVVDPKQGLIRDPDTGEIRPASKWELLKEVPYRQRLHTQSQEEYYRQKAEQRKKLLEDREKAKEKTIFQKDWWKNLAQEFGAGADEQGLLQEAIVPKPLDTKFLGEIYTEEPVTIVETPMAAMLRSTFLPSAAMAEGVGYLNDLIGGITEAPVKRREGAGYEKTQMQGAGAQTLTNALTGQGIWSYKDAHIMPPDEQYNGILSLFDPSSYMHEGTWGSLLTGLAGEVAAPMTPMGEVAAIPGFSLRNVIGKGTRALRSVAPTAGAQKALMTVLNPIEAFQYKGVKTQIDEALKAIDAGTTASKFEKELVKEGKMLNASNLRAKKAEFVGDVFGSVHTLDQIIDIAKRSSKLQIKLSALDFENSGFMKKFIKNLETKYNVKDLVDVATVEKEIAKVKNALAETTGLGKNGLAILRGMEDTAKEVVRVLETGDMPKFNAEIINRAISKVDLINDTTWLNTAKQLMKDNPTFIKEADRMITLSNKALEGTITPKESLEYALLYKKFKSEGIIKKFNAPSNPMAKNDYLYQSIRNAVSDVAKDTMLKQFTDNLIYVSPDVLVKPSKVQTSTGRMTPAYKDFRKTVSEHLDGTFSKDGLYFTPSDTALAKITTLQNEYGLTFPPSLTRDLDQLQKGVIDRITVEQYARELEPTLSSFFALEKLDGIRTRQGTLGASKAKDFVREELISATGKPSTAWLDMKSMSNALSFFSEKFPRLKNIFNRSAKDVPLHIQKLSDDIMAADTAAQNQVKQQLLRDPSLSPIEKINNTLRNILNDSFEISLQGIKTSARTDVSLGAIEKTTRADFVGRVDYDALYRPKTTKAREEIIRYSQERTEDIVMSELKKHRKNIYLAQERLKKLYDTENRVIQNTYGKAKENAKLLSDKAIQKLKTRRPIIEQKIKVSEDKAIKKNRPIKTKALNNELDNLIKNAQTRLQNVASTEKAYDAAMDLHKKEYIASRQMLEESIQQEEKALVDFFEGKGAENKLRDLQVKTQSKLNEIESKIKEKIQNLEEKEVIKSEDVALKRKLQQMSDVYGRDFVNDFLETQGIEPTWENIVKNRAFLEENMDKAYDAIFLKNQWERVIDDYFQAPKPVKKSEQKINVRQYWKNIFLDVIRQDKSLPFYIENNVLPLTVDNYISVIEKLREKNPVLKEFGLKQVKLNPFSKTREQFLFPLFKRMVDVQRTINMQKAIDSFMNNNPDMFLQVSRTQESLLGLESLNAIEGKIVNEIEDFVQRAVSMNMIERQTVDVILKRVREILFDGMMADIWKNSTRQVQKAFFEQYIQKMIDIGSPLVKDVDSFVIKLYKQKILKSDTFTKVEQQIQKIVDNVNDRLNEIQKGTEKIAGRALTEEEAQIYKGLEIQMPSMVNAMNNQYLMNLTTQTGGITDGLFTEALTQLNTYFSRFGVDNDILIENIRYLGLKYDYIGKNNIALIYGKQQAETIEKIISMANESSTASMLSSIQQKMADSFSGQVLSNVMWETAALTKRWAMQAFLAGNTIQSLRFLGMTAFTAPMILMTSLGKGAMKVGSVAKSLGYAAMSTFTASPIARRFNLGGKLKSNRYLTAPDGEIVISRQDGAIRDFTAKELRDLDSYYQIQTGMIETEFQVQQYNVLLADLKLEGDSMSRGKIQKYVLDNIDPRINNIFTEWMRQIDSQMRRYTFVDSLMNGEMVSQAIDKAKRSILDYSIITPMERKTISRVMWFWSFQRTMATNVVNSIYDALKTGRTSPPLKLIQLHDAINRNTLESYEGADDALRSRFFNIFTGTVDDVNMYAGGVINPQMQMFSFISDMSMIMLHSLDRLNDDTRRTEALLYGASQKYTDIFNTTQEGVASFGRHIALGSPLTSLLLDFWDASKGRWKPFPSELISAAEGEGKLPELIKLYGLQPRYKSPGRPLSSEGIYYDFPEGELGKQMVQKYLKHRLLGMTMVNIYTDIAGLTGNLIESGMPGAQTRGLKEIYRGLMYSEKDTTIASPFVEGEQVSLKDKSAYLKSLNAQSLNDMTSVLFMKYYLGLNTPVKDTPIELRLERALNALEKDIQRKKQRLDVGE